MYNKPFPRDFIRMELVIGRKYIVNNRLYFFIRSTLTGFNFYDENTNAVLLKRPLYKNKDKKSNMFFVHKNYKVSEHET